MEFRLAIRVIRLVMTGLVHATQVPLRWASSVARHAGGSWLRCRVAGLGVSLLVHVPLVWVLATIAPLPLPVESGIDSIAAVTARNQPAVAAAITVADSWPTPVTDTVPLTRDVVRHSDLLSGALQPVATVSAPPAIRVLQVDVSHRLLSHKNVRRPPRPGTAVVWPVRLTVSEFARRWTTSPVASPTGSPDGIPRSPAAGPTASPRSDAARPQHSAAKSSAAKPPAAKPPADQAPAAEPRPGPRRRRPMSHKPLNRGTWSRRTRFGRRSPGRRRPTHRGGMRLSRIKRHRIVIPWRLAVRAVGRSISCRASCLAIHNRSIPSTPGGPAERAVLCCWCASMTADMCRTPGCTTAVEPVRWTTRRWKRSAAGSSDRHSAGIGPWSTRSWFPCVSALNGERHGRPLWLAGAGDHRRSPGFAGSIRSAGAIGTTGTLGMILRHPRAGTDQIIAGIDVVRSEPTGAAGPAGSGCRPARPSPHQPAAAPSGLLDFEI